MSWQRPTRYVAQTESVTSTPVMPHRSLQKLAPDFVIPAGSQVVLKVDKQTGDGGFRKQGSVAVVVKCPPHNGASYSIDFADGSATDWGGQELVDKCSVRPELTG